MKTKLKAKILILIFIAVGASNWCVDLGDQHQVDMLEVKHTCSTLYGAYSKPKVRILCKLNKNDAVDFGKTDFQFAATTLEIVNCWSRLNIFYANFPNVTKIILRNTFMPCAIQAEASTEIEWFFDKLPIKEKSIQFRSCRSLPLVNANFISITTDFKEPVSCYLDNSGVLLGFLRPKHTKAEIIQIKSENSNPRLSLNDFTVLINSAKKFKANSLWVCPGDRKLAVLRSNPSFFHVKLIQCESKWKNFPDGDVEYFKKYLEALDQDKM